MPRARYGIEAALADIKRVHEELQSQKLRSQEIQRRRPVWKPLLWDLVLAPCSLLLQ